MGFDNKNKANDNKNSMIGGGKMKASTLIAKLEEIVSKYKTKYAWGCFGCPLKQAIIESKARQYPGWYNAAKKRELIEAGKQKSWGFDCVNMIKGVLWGWHGDWSKSWGGAEYNSNGVPDINANQMINCCSVVSSNFSNIVPGEAVWLPGHIGVYIGNGIVIESTSKWKNGVQKTALGNIGSVTGLPNRKWQKHGKMPYVVYDLEEGKKKSNTPTPKPNGKKTITELAKEVLDGKWGNGNDRKNKLQTAGYNYNEVQAAVNKLLRG